MSAVCIELAWVEAASKPRKAWLGSVAELFGAMLQETVGALLLSR
jgi:hypothetical protein